MVGKLLAQKLGVWKRARKVNLRQGDSSHLPEGNFVVNTTFKVFDFAASATPATVLRKFSLDAEVLYIGNWDCILGLYWLTENGSLIDTHDRWLQNAISGLVIPCSVRWIALVTVLDLDLKPLEDGEIVCIMDTS